jgi:DnaD/phage-associated family protein
MSSRTADQLINQGNGDAALLYLYLLRTGGLYDPAQAAKSLHWEGQRVIDAFTALEQFTLVEGPATEEPVTAAPSPEQAPDYTTDEISRELDNTASPFRGLLSAVEGKLGKKLPIHSLKLLLELYDYLGLPPEVILLLVNHMVEEEERKRGPGHRPTMAQIRTVGYRWAQKGIDSAEAVTAYLKKLDYIHSREGEVLAALGIRNRPAVATERKYIETWLDWGFEVPAISTAYEKTVLKTGQMNWPYCNSILKSWHKKGIHTPAEIAAENRPAPKQPPVSAGYKGPGAPIQPQAEEKTAQDVAWMKDFLSRQGE